MRRIVAIFSPGRVILVATIAAAIYLTVSAGSSLLHSYRLAGDESRLRDEVQALRHQGQQLQQIRDYLRTDEYVEFMARRVFGLVTPGEKLVIVSAPAAESKASLQQEDANQTGPPRTWWERLFGQ